MKKQHWFLGTAALALALGSTGIAPAQPPAGDANTVAAGKAAKGANRANRANRAGRQRPMPMVTTEVLGKVLGKTLTAEQSKAIEDANKTYLESVAKTVGLTTDELRVKMNEYRKTQRLERAGDGGKAGGGKAGGGKEGGGKAGRQAAKKAIQ